GQLDFRICNLIQTKDAVADRAYEVHVLIVVMVGGAFGRTYRIGRRPVEIKDLVQDPFFLEAAEYPIKGYAIYFVSDNFLQFGLRDSGFFGVDDFQNTQSGLGNPKLA